MTYTVHSIFKTLQGEGAWTGRPAVFCRFTGCNLWTGRERDRKKAICKFCDTDFVGGAKYETADELADDVLTAWGEGKQGRMTVLTGGEPALQYDGPLYQALKARGFFVCIETNGTVGIKSKIDWITVSPKAGTKIVQTDANELKVVYPQDGLDPLDAARVVQASYQTVQPMDGPKLRDNTADAVEFVLDNPGWRLGIQMHKRVGIE